MCTALWQLKWPHRCDSSGSYSADITMRTLVWQRWQLTVLRQRCQLPLLSQWYVHRCYTDMNIVVTALSVVTVFTLVCTVILQPCYCNCCCTVGTLMLLPLWRDVILHITSGLCTEHAHCAGLVYHEVAKMATIVTVTVGFVLYHWVYIGLPIPNITAIAITVLSRPLLSQHS